MPVTGRTSAPLLCRLWIIRAFSSCTPQTPPIVRTRFAPSPTGDIHLGGLRSALYNYLFARQHGGQFLLRIEDTDSKRLVQGAAQRIESLLNRLGINFDESPTLSGPHAPYTQSERLQLYSDAAQRLLDSGHAYRCFCSRQRLDFIRRTAIRDGHGRRYDGHCRHLSARQISDFESRNVAHVVRLKLDPSDEPFEDLIHGSHQVDIGSQEGDAILLKSDGYPTYHLASVVDDHLMNITHVMRGIEWLVSTPKHLAIYRALGWRPPHYAHLPLICNSDGTKLSKRAAERSGHGTAEELLSAGFLPEAIVNYVCLSGGGFHQLDCDQLTLMPQLVEMFDISKVTARVTHLHHHHLHRLNLQAMRRAFNTSNSYAFSTSRTQMVDTLRQIVNDTDIDAKDACSAQFKLAEKQVSDSTMSAALRFVLDTGRVHCLSDLVTQDFAYLWTRPNIGQLVQHYQRDDAVVGCLPLVIDHLKQKYSSDTTMSHRPADAAQFKNELVDWLKLLCERRQLNFTRLMFMLRMALSGISYGPGVSEIIYVLGVDEALRRLSHSLSQLRHFQSPPPPPPETQTQTEAVAR